MRGDTGFVSIAITAIVLLIILAMALWAMVFVNRGAAYAVSVMTSIGNFNLSFPNVTPLATFAIWATIAAIVLMVIVAALRLIRGEEERNPYQQ